MTARSGAPRDCGKTWFTSERYTVYDTSAGTEHRCGRPLGHQGDHRCITMGQSCPATLPKVVRS